MKWYPWLNAPYRKILSHYQQSRGHHALLIHSQPGNGEASLCYAISRWLMCRQPNGSKSCSVCYNCLLMISDKHPDFYQLKLGKDRMSLGVDSIRTIIDSIYGRARQGGVKVVWLPHIEQLTEQAANALLKALEEPPEDTYFLLICQTLVQLLPTLRSRCLYWPLPTSNEELCLRWLRKVGYDEPLSACTALRLSGGAPLAAEILLQPARWQDRLALCATLQDVLANGDFLMLLPVLNRDKDNGPLHWMLSLIADALKWQQGAQEFLANTDRTPLVATMAERWPSVVLLTQWRHWLHCLRQCKEISGVNRELLLTHYLLNWEQGITDAYASL